MTTDLLWKGRPLTELSREELLEVVEHLDRRVRRLELVAWPHVRTPDRRRVLRVMRAGQSAVFP